MLTSPVPFGVSVMSPLLSVLDIVLPSMVMLSATREPPVMAPVVVMVEEPLFMLPKPDVMEPEAKAPTVVRLDVTTPVPRVLLLSTSVPAILRVSLVVAKSMSTFD